MTNMFSCFHFFSSLSRSFSSAVRQSVPVYSTSKLWTKFLKLRCCIKNCNTSNLRNFQTLRAQNVKQIGKWMPHGLAVATGIGVGTLLLSQNNVVECKVKHRERTRLVGQTEESYKADVDFDWKQFLYLLWPDIYSLALAIVVGVPLFKIR